MTRAQKAIEALRKPDASLQRVPNTVRQSIADVISDLTTWQPIETAPKDATDIIVYRPKFDGDYIPKVGVDYWSERLGGVWAKSRKDTPPTHWMPLPTPPQT